MFLGTNCREKPRERLVVWLKRGQCGQTKGVVTIAVYRTNSCDAVLPSMSIFELTDDGDDLRVERRGGRMPLSQSFLCSSVRSKVKMVRGSRRVLMVG